MRYQRVHIESLAFELPPVVVTSDEIEKRLEKAYKTLGLPPGILFDKTGIRERRLWEPEDTLSDASTRVINAALDKTNITRKDIGDLVQCSISHQGVEPATAVLVHDKLGLPPSAGAHDITNACAGWVNGLMTVANQIELGQIKAGVVVTSESITPVLEATINLMNEKPSPDVFRDCFATLTMGSGSAAAILTDRSISSTEHRFLGGTQMTFSEYNQLCTLATMQEPVKTDTKTLLKAGLDGAEVCWKAFLEEFEWKAAEVDVSIFHQVSQMHRDMMVQRLGVNPETNPVSYDILGNIGSCSVPITLCMAEERGLLRTGNKVSLNSIGGGISVMMMGIQW